MNHGVCRKTECGGKLIMLYTNEKINDTKYGWKTLNILMCLVCNSLYKIRLEPIDSIPKKNR
jgi:hypothetical protein